MIKANFSAYGTYVTDSLYQWEFNRVLTVSGLNLAKVPEVHFTNANMDRAIVRQAAMEDHIISVNIPNSLLQEPLPIYAHIGTYDGDEFKIAETVTIPVIARTRPYDYQIINDDDEIYSFEALKNHIANMVKSGDFNAAKTALNARIDNIIANANNVAGNSELVDIRVDIDGNIHNSAGEAIRKQFSNLKNELSVTDIIANRNRLNLKYQNIIEGNLIDKSTMITPYFIQNDGSIADAQEGYYVTDYIPVYEKNIWNANNGSTSLMGYAVYDANFNPLRTYNGTSKLYEYQSGDAYIRIMFRETGVPTARAFYGDADRGYSDFKSIVSKLNNVRFIGTQIGCDYTTVQEALTAITDDSETNPYIFYITPGTYETFTMYYTDNTRLVRYGRVRWISLIGLDVNSTIFTDNRGNYLYSPCEIWTNGVVKNITFVNKTDMEHFSQEKNRTMSYAVHSDFGTCKTRYENCVFYSNAGPAVGVGTWLDEILEFYNCRFESDNDGVTFSTETNGAFFCHACTSGDETQRHNQVLRMVDCICIAPYLTFGGRLTVVEGYEGTYNYELRNVGFFGKNGANVSITNPKNDLFGKYCFNNKPDILNVID